MVLVFKPFGLIKGIIGFQAIWSGKGYGFQAISGLVSIGSSNHRKLG